MTLDKCTAIKEEEVIQNYKKWSDEVIKATEENKQNSKYYTEIKSDLIDALQETTEEGYSTLKNTETVKNSSKVVL